MVKRTAARSGIPLEGPIFPPDPDNEGGSEGLKSTVAAMQKQMAEMQKAMDQGRERERRLLVQLAAGAKAPARDPNPERVHIQPHKVEIKADDLGDPVTDPKGYSEKLTNRVTQQIGAVLATAKAQSDEQAQAAQAQAAIAGRVDMMWNKMLDAHPEFEGIKDIVEAQAKKLVAEGVAMGGTVDSIVFADPASFIEDVAEKVVERATELGIKFEVGDPQQQQQQQDPNRQPSNIQGGPTGPGGFPATMGADSGDDPGNKLTGGRETNRTASLKGGDFGTPAPKPQPQAHQPSNLVAELRDIQRAMGIM